MASVYRHATGDPGAQDLPVAAAAYNAATGTYYWGFAQDREMGDPDAHAERQVLRRALADSDYLGNLTIGVTVEPCPSCLDYLAAVNVSSVVFGAGRQALEDRRLLRHHPDKVFDLVTGGQMAGKSYPQITQTPDAALRRACESAFDGFDRDFDTGTRSYQPPKRGQPRGIAFRHLTSPELLARQDGQAVVAALARAAQALQARFGGSE